MHGQNKGLVPITAGIGQSPSGSAQRRSRYIVLRYNRWLSAGAGLNQTPGFSPNPYLEFAAPGS